MAKPSVTPVFSELDQTDPISMQPNVKEPIPSYINYGWPFKSFPNRQNMNYLFRWITRWLTWINNNNLSGTIPMKLFLTGRNFTSAYGGILDTGAINFNMHWERSGNVVTCHFISSVKVEIRGTLDAGVPELNLEIEPQFGYTYPDAFIKSYFDNISFLVRADGIVVPGILQIAPMAHNSVIKWYIQGLPVMMFGSDTVSDNGIACSSFSFIVNEL